MNRPHSPRVSTGLQNIGTAPSTGRAEMTDNPTASIPGANAVEEDGSVPLPSYEERYKQEKSWSLNDRTRLSADAVRIRWAWGVMF